MKFTWAQAATFLSTLASAASTPSPSASANSSPNVISNVAGTAGPDHVSIHFKTPCQGCFSGSGDDLELTLEIDAADEECTSSPPRLNGLPLTVNNSDGLHSGQVSFRSHATHGDDEQEITAFWESTCLKGEASMLSVHFDDIAGDTRVRGGSGFTASFKQTGTPTVLRLHDRPVDRVTNDDDACEMWVRPDNASRLSIGPLTPGLLAVDELLDVQYQKLDELKSQISTLHEQLLATEVSILSLVKDEFKSCTSLKCLWKTAKSQAPRICKLISAHFSHHKGRITGCTDGDGQSACTAQEADMAPGQSPTTPPIQAESETEPTRPAADGPGASTHIPSYYSGEVEETEPPESPSDGSITFSSDDANAVGAADTSHDSPAEVPDLSSPSDDIFNPSYNANGDTLLIADEGTVDQAIRHRLIWSVLALLLLTLIIAILIRTIKYCRNPRLRVDCAAVWEERRTKRLYRKAAFRHKWKTWWKQLRRQAIGDYEEKREMILEQEGISEDSLQREIRTLRQATDLVRDLVAAEEGRSPVGQHATPTSYQATYPSPYTSPEYTGDTVSIGYSESLPSYAPPPPRYGEELHGEVTVVDGFMYPSSASDDTAESSIVDCSPRLSFETGRSTILTRDPRD